jgi:hypothetical protein
MISTPLISEFGSTVSSIKSTDHQLGEYAALLKKGIEVYVSNDKLNQVPGAITSLTRRGRLKVNIQRSPPIEVELHQAAVRLQLLGDFLRRKDTLQNQ